MKEKSGREKEGNARKREREKWNKTKNKCIWKTHKTEPSHYIHAHDIGPWHETICNQTYDVGKFIVVVVVFIRKEKDWNGTPKNKKHTKLIFSIVFPHQCEIFIRTDVFQNITPIDSLSFTSIINKLNNPGFLSILLSIFDQFI